MSSQHTLSVSTCAPHITAQQILRMPAAPIMPPVIQLNGAIKAYRLGSLTTLLQAARRRKPDISKPASFAEN